MLRPIGMTALATLLNIIENGEGTYNVSFSLLKGLTPHDQRVIRETMNKRERDGFIFLSHVDPSTPHNEILEIKKNEKLNLLKTLE